MRGRYIDKRDQFGLGPEEHRRATRTKPYQYIQTQLDQTDCYLPRKRQAVDQTDYLIQPNISKENRLLRRLDRYNQTHNLSMMINSGTGVEPVDNQYGCMQREVHLAKVQEPNLNRNYYNPTVQQIKNKYGYRGIQMVGYKESTAITRKIDASPSHSRLSFVDADDRFARSQKGTPTPYSRPKEMRYKNQPFRQVYCQNKSPLKYQQSPCKTNSDTENMSQRFAKSTLMKSISNLDSKINEKLRKIMGEIRPNQPS